MGIKGELGIRAASFAQGLCIFDSKAKCMIIKQVKPFLEFTKELEQQLKEANSIEIEQFLMPEVLKYREAPVSSSKKIRMLNYRNNDTWQEKNIEYYLEKVKDNQARYAVDEDHWNDADLSSSGNDYLLQILVVGELGLSTAQHAHIKLAVAGSPFVLLLVPNSYQQISDRFFLDLQELVGVIIPIEHGTLENMDIRQQVLQLLQANVLPNLLAYQAANKFEHLGHLLEQKKEQVRERIQLKKSRAEQDLKMAQRKQGALQVNHGQVLRQKSEERFQQFQIRMRDQLEAELGEKHGKTVVSVSKVIVQMPPLDKKKEAKQSRYIIPEDFSQEILRKIRDNAQQSIQIALSNANQALAYFEQDLRRYVAESGLDLPTGIPPLLTEESIQQLLNNQISYKKQFEGTIRSRKFMEFFTGARSWWMIAYMVGAMFGFRFSRNLPLTILLVLLGIYYVWNTQRKEKREQQYKYEEQARLYLAEQLSRIVQDLQRAIEKLISEKVRTTMDYLLEKASGLLRSATSHKQSHNQNQIGRYRQIIDELQKQERRLDNLNRNRLFKDKLEREYQKIRKTLSDYRAIFSNSR